MNQKNLYLHNISLSFEECAKFLAKQNIKPFNAEENYPQEYNELMEFFIRYSYLSHAVNVIYSKKIHKNGFFSHSEWIIKDILQKYNFSWIKDEGKLHTASVIMNGLLNKIEGSEFYEEYCFRVLSEKGHFYHNFSKMKILNYNEILQLLKTLIWDEIVEYANLQKESLNHIFMKFKYENLCALHTKLKNYSFDLVSAIEEESGESYFTNDYDDTFAIEVTSIKTFNVKIQEAYLGLRECIISVFPKQKDVAFPFNAYSVLGDAMFSAPNINFKDFIKLIIKSKDIKAFVDNVKLKGSEFMELNNWSEKIYFNIGNIILLFMNNEEYKARLIKEFKESQLSQQKVNVNSYFKGKH